MTKQTIVRLSEELHSKVKEAATEQNLSINQYILNALERSLKEKPVPLVVIEQEDGGILYHLPSPETWTSLEESTKIKCGDMVGEDQFFCPDCGRSWTAEIEGCGKWIT